MPKLTEEMIDQTLADLRRTLLAASTFDIHVHAHMNDVTKDGDAFESFAPTGGQTWLIVTAPPTEAKVIE